MIPKPSTSPSRYGDGVGAVLLPQRLRAGAQRNRLLVEDQPADLRVLPAPVQAVFDVVARHAREQRRFGETREAEFYGKGFGHGTHYRHSLEMRAILHAEYVVRADTINPRDSALRRSGFGTRRSAFAS